MKQGQCQGNYSPKEYRTPRQPALEASLSPSDVCNLHPVRSLGSPDFQAYRSSNHQTGNLNRASSLSWLLRRRHKSRPRWGGIPCGKPSIKHMAFLSQSPLSCVCHVAGCVKDEISEFLSPHVLLHVFLASQGAKYYQITGSWHKTTVAHSN